MRCPQPLSFKLKPFGLACVLLWNSSAAAILLLGSLQQLVPLALTCRPVACACEDLLTGTVSPCRTCASQRRHG